MPRPLAQSKNTRLPTVHQAVGKRVISLEAEITIPAPTPPDRALSAHQPRARGRALVCVKGGARGTVLADLRQSGSLKVLFPRTCGPSKQAVFVNTAGGITGGDQFNISAHVVQTGHLTLTTQACERAYRAIAGAVGTLDAQLTVDDGARLDWLPQETLIFNGANLRRKLRFDLTGSARLLFVEPLIFGRAAMGETVTDAQISDRIEIWRDGRIAYLDALRLAGNIAAHMALGTTAAGARAMASAVLVAPEAEGLLLQVRSVLPPSAGASLLAPDLLCLRLLADDGFTLRQTLMPVLNILSGAQLPKPWML